MLWNGSPVMDGLSGSGSAGGWLTAETDFTADVDQSADPPRPHRLSNVFQVLRPYILKGGIDLAPDLPMGIIGQANPARFCDAFKPCGDVDTQ
jgi:hypothetical protein